MNGWKIRPAYKSNLVLSILVVVFLVSIQIEGLAQIPIPTPPPTLISNRCSAYAAPMVPSPLRTFYINAFSGSDSNNGLTPTTAWLTLSKANNLAQPGDLFLLRGTFTNQWINPANSGTSVNKITYRKESGQAAVINQGLYDGGVILQNGQSHIVVDGLEIKNVEYSIEVSNGANNNWFRNLYIHNGGGIGFKDGANNNRVEDSVLTEIGSLFTNAGDSILLLNNVDNNVVVRNYFGNAGHAAYNDTVQGSSTGLNENNILAQNIVNNKNATNVIVGGRSFGTLIECNEIKNASRETVNPILIYPRQGIQYSGDNGIIRYNQIFNNKSDGIIITGYIFAATQQQYPENNQFYHNTIVGNGRSGLYIHASDTGYPGASAYVRINPFANNIFWNNAGSDGANRRFYDITADFYNANNPWSAGFTDGNVFRYNNASNIPFFIVVRRPTVGGNLYYETPALTESVIPSWTNNSSVDPLFTSFTTSDYSLQSGSPMIDTGRIIPGVLYNGGAPDKGAFESGVVKPTSFDFDDDGRADISTFRPSDGKWYLQRSKDGFTSVTFGSSTDIIVPADYDGDGKTDIAVYRPSTGTWYLQRNSLGFTGIRFGDVNDIPAPADYDGDGKADIAVFRPSNGTWYLLKSTEGFGAVRFGANEDIPVQEDYDGDGKTDIAVFRPSSGYWYRINSGNASLAAFSWGLPTDKPVPADYDGDSKTDIAVWRPSNAQWYVFRSSTNSSIIYNWGTTTDLPLQIRK